MEGHMYPETGEHWGEGLSRSPTDVNEQAEDIMICLAFHVSLCHD